MARTDWMEGLSPRAKRLVEGASFEETSVLEGAWNQFALKTYVLSDGRVVDEEVQAAPWASGPHYFLALKEYNEWVEESLWTEAEMDAVIGPPMWPGTRLPD